MPLLATARKPTLWLHPRRLFAYGLILALGIWSVYAWLLTAPGLLDRNGLLKGTDFLHFYVLGTLANQHCGGDLYNIAVQTDLAHQRVPVAGYPIYVPMYPPQVSLLFGPWARLPYGWALGGWLVSSGFLCALCCYLSWRTCPRLANHGWMVAILALAYPGFFHLLLWGQTSALALLCFTLAYLALRTHQHFLAGLAIGSLIFKPPLGLAAAFVFLLAREWKLVAGALTAAAVQLSIGWLYYGPAVLRDYLDRVLRMREILPEFEPRPYQMHSLWAFWQLLVPVATLAFGLYVVTTAGVLLLTLRCWRSPAPLTLRYGVLLFATVLVAPHLTIYDLAVLAPAFLLLADWLAERSAPPPPIMIRTLLVAYLLPLIPQAKWTHVQFSVIAMGLLLWALTRTAQSCQVIGNTSRTPATPGSVSRVAGRSEQA
jgi:hypothetical protein